MEPGNAAVRLVELKNHPAPAVPQKIRDRIRELGGVVPGGFGPYAGKPVIELLWGQTATAFECGKNRTRFVDPHIDPIFKTRAFRLSENGMSELAKYERIRKRKMGEALKESRWDDYHALLFAPMSYFLRRFVPVADWEELPLGSSYEATAKLLPEGWSYFEDIPEVTEIGCPNFYAVQWLPGPQIDEQWNWETNRFGNNALLEFRGDDRFVDILGPWPRYGYYWNVLFKIEAENGGFAMPDEHNCLEPLRRMLEDARSAKKKDTGQRIKKRYEDTVGRERLASAARSKKRKEFLMEKGRIIRVGNMARIYPADDAINWGKPTETIIADKDGKLRSNKNG